MPTNSSVGSINGVRHVTRSVPVRGARRSSSHLMIHAPTMISASDRTSVILSGSKTRLE